MGESSIEWTDETWNPVTGCSKVSPGCAHCYAEAWTSRFPDRFYPDGQFRAWTPANAERNVVLRHERLEHPLRWRRPRMVFVNSMSDLFHDRVPDTFIADVFAVMALADRHTFQVLTKRPERMRRLLSSADWTGMLGDAIERRAGDEWTITVHHDSPVVLPNVWLGTSIENRRYIARANDLRATPAAVRFLSCEPLLGPLTVPRTAARRRRYGARAPLDYREALGLNHIDWLIVGGESGPGHRPFDLGWARDLRDDCASPADPALRTAFFLKQTGGHRPGAKLEDLPEDLQIREMPARGVTTGGR